MNTSILTTTLAEFKTITGINIDAASIKTDDLDYTINQIKSICKMYKEAHNLTFFLRNIITGKIDYEIIYRDSISFHLPIEYPRALLLLETKHPIDNTVLTILNYIFSNQQNVYIIPFSDTQIVLIHPYKSETPFKEQMRNICHTIIDTLNTEALIPVKISCSAPANHLHELHSAYEQALTTMRIGKRFHLEQPVFFYDELGASRLLYHIPDHICVDFLNEVWNNCIPTDPDPELISTINCFLYNNLNIAETARELHMHRNTLLYRIEKINNLTNLDIRNFTDAMTLKLALMIMKQNK